MDVVFTVVICYIKGYSKLGPAVRTIKGIFVLALIGPFGGAMCILVNIDPL